MPKTKWNLSGNECCGNCRFYGGRNATKPPNKNDLCGKFSISVKRNNLWKSFLRQKKHKKIENQRLLETPFISERIQHVD